MPDKIVKKTIGLTFGDAIHYMKNGSAMQRLGWNGKGMYVFIRPAVTDADPDNGKEDHLAYICMKTAQGDFVPWLASQADMLVEDWSEVDAR